MKKSFQRLIVGVLLTALILSSTISSSVMSAALNSDSDINVVIDGTRVTFTQNSGAPFIDSANRTLVPLRVTMEQFGATVDWNQENQLVIIEKDGITVRVPIGKNYIYKNETTIPNDTAAIIKDGRTYLPVRAVLEAFGADVSWNTVNRSVVVTSPAVFESEVGAGTEAETKEETKAEVEEEVKPEPVVEAEVEVVDFSAFFSESNDKREEELKKAYKYKISDYTGNFSKTLDYFGGAKAFNEAENKVLQALSDKNQVTYYEFASILLNAMSFIQDNHFSINNTLVIRSTGAQQYYYRCYNQNFAKDEHGYYKVYNNTKWYVVEFSSDAVSVKPTLLSSGKIVYSPVYFGPITQLGKATEVTLSDGVSIKNETLRWVKTSAAFNGQNIETGSDMIADLSGTKYIPFRRPLFIDKNISVYQNAGSTLKSESLIIVDNRSNGGGGDRCQQAWFETFAGATFEKRDAKAYKVNKFSIVDFANGGNRYTRESAYLGQWRTVLTNGKWFSNNTKIIVLMDGNTGSSGENMMYMLRTLDNVIFVGSNTAGCTLCGNIIDIYLPNSGMQARSGMMLSLPEKDQNIDGIGLEPDIWWDPNSSLEEVLKMIKHYEIQ